MSFRNESVMWNNSIYIPTIYQSISKEDLWDYLEKNFGKISRIDFVNLNENCRRAFVHFSEWYTDKYICKIVRNKIETDGIYEFIMPTPNSKWFQGKMLINKKPLSATDCKVNNVKKWMEVGFQRIHILENTVNDMKSKVSYLEDKIEELLSSKNEDYNHDYDYEDNGPMDISELQKKPNKNKSKLISQGCYNTRIQDLFYDNDNTRFGFEEGRGGCDRFVA